MTLLLDTDKRGIDLGIVVRDATASLAFYRDTLGLRYLAEMPLPGGGGVMHRLDCAGTVLKLVATDVAPEASNPGGGARAASGIRYFTISVRNLDEATDACANGGYSILLGPTQIRPGVRIAMIADPDGNPVELLQAD